MFMAVIEAPAVTMGIIPEIVIKLSTAISTRRERNFMIGLFASKNRSIFQSYPLTAPAVTPATICFCRKRYRIRIGSMASSSAAITSPISVE